MKWHGRYEQTLKNLKHTPPQFDSYDKFLEAARKNRENSK